MSGSARLFRALGKRISECGDMEISVHRLTLATVMAHAGLNGDGIGESDRDWWCVEARILEPMLREAEGLRPDLRIWP